MKILFFTYDVPYPTTSGGKVRAFNLLKYSHRRGDELHLFSFSRGEYDARALDELKDIGVKEITVFPRRKVRDIRNAKTFLTGKSLFHILYYDKQVAQALSSYVKDNGIAIVHFESFYTACYMNDALAKQGVKQIYGSENIEHRLYEDYVKHKVPFLFKPGFQEQARRIKREEIDIARRSDLVLAVTQTEKSFFSNISDKPVTVIENGVSLKEFAYQERLRKKEQTILFVGNFDYFPNLDAVNFFYHRVFTRLQDRNVTFSIIGKGSEQFRAFSDPRVKTTEFITDIKVAYYEADIFVSPIAIGGGTNFKILEAMATGLPVVTFSDRIKDIGAVKDRDVLVGNDPDSFLKQVERLLDDHTLAKKLGVHARKVIEEKYSWEVIGGKLHTAWKELYEKH